MTGPSVDSSPGDRRMAMSVLILPITAMIRTPILGTTVTLGGSSVRLPLSPAPQPSAEDLEWHGDMVVRG